MNLASKKFNPILILSTVLYGLNIAAANEPQYEDHANIVRTVKQYINLHVQKTHREFTIKVGRIDPRHRLPRCNEALKAEITGNGTSTSAMTVAVRCAAPSPWLLYVPNKVSIFKSIYIARQTMARGHPIIESDLQLTRRNISRLHYGYIDKKDDIIGKVTRRVVFANTILKLQMLSLPLLVKTGQTVVLIAETHGIQVRMSGKALSSAPRGQAIRVRNLSSRRIVEGIVVRTGVVKISL